MYSYIFLCTVSSSFSYFIAFSFWDKNTTYCSNQFFLFPIINNLNPLIISMLIRNIILFLFCFVFSYYLGNSTFVKSIVELFNKPTIHTITSMYLSSSFFFLGFANES